MKNKFLFLFTFVLAFLPIFLYANDRDMLSPEEDLFLHSRNNTIIVYPERNNPPFVYQSPGGNIQGLAIDYIELIAEKLGAKIQYLNPQSRNQVLNDFISGKGDIVVGVTETSERNSSLIFTENFVIVPTVIVVRKDYKDIDSLSPSDLNGKRVSVINGSALEEYLRQNYPRIILEDVTDDEVSLQQVILADVEAAVMDIASLSYYLSKQVLNNVKVVGGAGLDYKPAFALRQADTMLQSIIEKGMSQISANERNVLTEKWITVPTSTPREDSLMAKIQNTLFTDSVYVLYILLGLCILGIAIIIARSGSHSHFGLGKRRNINELKEEVYELERMNEELSKELNIVKAEEDRIQQKIESLEK